MAGEGELQPSSEDNLAETVRAAYEQHAEAIVKDAPEGETDDAKAERRRNEHGQFVARDKVERDPVAAPEKEITDADRRDEQAVQPSKAAGPPTSWSAGEKAEWSKLPPAVQQAVIRRETEINEGGRQWSEQRKTFEQALAPVSELSTQYGMPASDVVARLVNVEKRLNSPEAPRVIAELAQAYKVNLAALVNGSQQPQSRGAQQQIDPNQLAQWLDQRVEQRLSAAQQAQEVTYVIENFADEKDATGKSAHEHFNDVKTKMGHLLASGQAADMQDAYDQAVWATPDIRAKLLAAQTRPAAGQNQVARSKRAAISKVGLPNGTVANEKPRYSSVEDAVRAAYAQHAGEA